MKRNENGSYILSDDEEEKDKFSFNKRMNYTANRFVWKRNKGRKVEEEKQQMHEDCCWCHYTQREQLLHAVPDLKEK